MEIILCAFDDALYNAWKKVLKLTGFGMEEKGHTISVCRGDITALQVTAVVSPANSYGYMRGGVDLAYTRRFGNGLERRLQQMIGALPGALLPVGEALVVSTGDSTIPYCISVPTMERPMRLKDAAPVLAASKAATVIGLKKGFARVAFPGMGTGTGGLDTGTAAQAMLAGISAGFEG